MPAGQLLKDQSQDQFFQRDNLAATVNVLLYDRLAKSDYDSSLELIRTSRDTNNRLRLDQ